MRSTPHHSGRVRSGNRRLRLVGYIAVAALGLSLAAPAGAKAAGTARVSPVADRGGKPNFDSRTGSTFRPVQPQSVLGARDALARSLGQQGEVQIDPLTGTPRVVAKLDGFLTGPSRRPARQVAVAYVREHLAAFGLSRGDLATLHLVKEYVDILGTHHLVWQQQVRGIPAFDNGLRAALTARGQLVNVMGSPIHHLSVPSTSPRISADAAVGSALRNAGAADAKPGRASSRSSDARLQTTFADGNRASLVLFFAGRRTTLAWQVNAQASSTGDYVSVVDASSGKVLWRANMVSFADQTGHGRVWEYYDSSLLPSGVGSQALKNFPVKDGTRLFGNNAHVYKDVTDDNTPVTNDEVKATSGVTWNYNVADDTSDPFNNCDPQWACTWDSGTANSWRTNIRQNATQVYYYLNQFHNHLLAAPIGFNEGAGNFELVNSSGNGVGHDAVQGQVDDGANTASGFPDQDHQVNANMATAQDGVSPRMQMYLFPAFELNSTAPSANGGDEADVIYHEYTHGLSHRLVTGPTGIPALNSFQSGAMGEAWSDWYAMDYLVDKNFDADTATIGDLQIGFFVGGGTTIPLRSEPMDCPADGTAHGGACPGDGTAGAGGYTYGDMGKIVGQPEVHADGEIWGQTLWQLRQVLGSNTTETIITRGMELSPQNPSMLDMRNAILQADRVAFGGSHKATIWNVFAKRGMGFFADSKGGNDIHPHQDFHKPPNCATTNCFTVSGKVTDRDTGKPVGGARVRFGGFTTGFPGDMSARTNSTGHYTIHNVPAHTYRRLITSKNGYETNTLTSVAVSGNKTVNPKIRRDWAALSGGARIVSFTKPDYTRFGCGPAGGFDLSQATGWGSDAPNNGHSGVTGPRSVVVRLPRGINVINFAIDPGPACGDPVGAAVKAFTISTRKSSNSSWVVAVNNTATLSVGPFHTLSPSAGKRGVHFVKLTMKSRRGGSPFMDMTELEVHGKPA
jgi:extracellular elastinolytic metalloproteinase